MGSRQVWHLGLVCDVWFDRDEASALIFELAISLELEDVMMTEGVHNDENDSYF